MKSMHRIVAALILPLMLTACNGAGVSTSSSTTSSAYKPVFGLNLDQASSATLTKNYTGVRLDVIVPIFEPGIPDNSDDYEKLGIWPEVRRTEAIRFASSLRDELIDTSTFGDVRLSPDISVAGDLFVLGEIKQSNGEDIEIGVQVYAVSGKRWMNKTYRHRTEEYHWKDLRKAGKDPYQPLFAEVAEDIADLIRKRSSDELAELRAISDLQFANVFSNNVFIEHLEFDKKNNISLASLPAENDPMLVRTRQLRAADGLFMDTMQGSYSDFVAKTEDSYLAWQEHSMNAVKDQRSAQNKAVLQGLVGALLLIGAASAADSSDNSTLEGAAIGAAAIGGVVMLQKSFAASADGKFHKETINEAGQSLNFEVAPQVIAVEEETVTLRGDVQEQYRQWRSMLSMLYEQEATPNVQL